MSRKTITALALAAVAAGLTLSCSDGVVEPGELFQGSGTVQYFTFEGGFWAIEGDDGETYDPVGGVPPAFENEGMRVEFLAKMTGNPSFHMVGPVVEVRDIWPEGSRFPH